MSSITGGLNLLCHLWSDLFITHAQIFNFQLLLEAPDDITFFRFCPTDPNIIAGGCLNGQIVLWDISGYVDRLKAQKSSKRPKKNTMNSLVSYYILIHTLE